MRTRRRRRPVGVVAVLGSVVLATSACGNAGVRDDRGTGRATGAFVDCATRPNDCNTGKVKPGGTMTFAIEKKLSGWNIADVSASSFDFQQVLAGVLPSAFVSIPDLGDRLNSDLLSSAEMTGVNPQAIVYTIKPEAVWSDGTPISADDFIYAWRTRNGVDCPECKVASTAGYEQIKSVTGSDGGKTVTVVYKTPYVDWHQTFGNIYPAHIAARQGGLAASFAWFGENRPDYSGGPYLISAYEPDRSITEVPNPRWYGATKPQLDRLVFRIVTDQNQEVPALRNNEVQVIYPVGVNRDIVDQVRRIPDVQYSVGKGLKWEHLDLNVRNPLLRDRELRRAILMAVDRTEIIEKTVGQYAPDITPLNMSVEDAMRFAMTAGVSVTEEEAEESVAAEEK